MNMRFSELLAYLSEKSFIQSKANLEVRTKILEKNEHSAIVVKESYKGKRLVYRAYFYCFNTSIIKKRNGYGYTDNWSFFCPTKDQVRFFKEKFAPLVESS